MRIWTRALQPVQEEVSSWRFCRAKTVSGPPAFSSPAGFSPGAGILTPAKILSSACFSARRQYFVNPPDFLKSAKISQIRLIFVKASIFSKSTWFSEKRQYFSNPPESAAILWIRLIFPGCKYLFIFSVFIFCILIKYAPIFYLRNCFNLRFKIDIVVMIVWSIVIIINFVLTL